MKKILGIDLGTNSLGWALIEEETKLVDGGVVIFPRGNNEDLKTGKESSYSQQRTTYRGARRLLFRRKLRRKRLLNIAQDIFHMKPEDIYSDTDPFNLYRLRKEGLDRVLNEKELFRICLYFAKKRGFLSNRKSEARANDDSGVVKKAISELDEKFHSLGFRTLGEYYYHLASEHRSGRLLDERIVGRYTSRAMYQSEFDLIINRQLSLKSKFLTDDIARELKKEIFYQRPLKSAKHLIGKCRFEDSKRCMPRSHPIFQEFRAWNIINNLRWVNHDTAETDGLTADQKMKAFQYFNSEIKLTETKLKKVVGLSTRVKFSDIELKPCKTRIEIYKALSQDNINLNDEAFLKLYHCLLFTQDQNFDKFKDYVSKTWQISSNTAQVLWDIKLEPDYSNISCKAANKILPFITKGMRYDEACIEAGYHHSKKIAFKNLEKIPFLKTNEMRNPVVQKAISTTIALVNKIITVYGKPDEVRIELARELKRPRVEREKMRSRNKAKSERREQYQEILEKHFGRTVAYSDSILNKYELWLELGCKEDGMTDFEDFARNTKKVDLTKYQLWLEADRISPYTGRVISLSTLLSPEIEIEHILPYSRSLDNSFMNKTLCERSFNVHQKQNMTPLEYFNKRPNHEKDEFVKRISLLSNSAKRNMFLCEIFPDSFSNNQLTDTAYIALKAIEKIQLAIEKVYPTKGGVTAILRKQLGLNSILHYGDDANIAAEYKNRGDHRHHFIDAVVIATTTNTLLKQLSSANASFGKIEVDIQAPWQGFRSDIEEKVNQILVVHRQNIKLVKSNINRYKHGNKGVKDQLTKSIRGSMHEDTLYGKITNPYTQEENYVIKKNINSLDEKQLEKIIDVKIKEFLKEQIAMKGSWAEVLKNPIIFHGKPLRSVRWRNTASELKLLRRDTDTYVESGNNFVLAIYESEDGKRDFETVSFIKAVERKTKEDDIYPRVKNNKKLLFTIQALDKFIMYHVDKDEINWEDKTELAAKLYHIRKFTKDNFYVGKSTVAKFDTAKFVMPFSKQFSVNTAKIIKIKLDLLGNIVWRSDKGKL
ncbi:MAG TPA: type II CRISPR RNA-guided endonuclease Cas9 [Saprospiraceae bacterium]|nr:type II CRISPR RNA-guided endonuclease Cas9 [Saprospiraceae bacterium]